MIEVDTEKCKADVDASIVRVILPMAYKVIDELLNYAPDAPKELYVRARGLLPKGYANSFVKDKK